MQKKDLSYGLDNKEVVELKLYQDLNDRTLVKDLNQDSLDRIYDYLKSSNPFNIGMPYSKKSFKESFKELPVESLLKVAAFNNAFKRSTSNPNLLTVKLTPAPQKCPK